MNNLLETGLNAIERGNFLEAIKLLQEYCQEYELNSIGSFREYIQAQANLIKAYTYANNKPQAIVHCKKLITSEYPQVREWAKKVLTSLSPQAVIPESNEVSTVNITQQSLYTFEEVVGWLKAIDKSVFYGNNTLAINLLEPFCKSVSPDSKEYLYAQVLLVEAYHNDNQREKAVELSQQLCDSKHYLTQRLANHYLSTSSIDIISENVLVVNGQSLITPVEASQLFQKGYDAIVSKDYTKAIQIFEEYHQSASPSRSEYLQASKWLLKVYQANQQLDNAIDLCQQLLTCQHKPTRRWARELLFTDLFNNNKPLPLISLVSERKQPSLSQEITQQADSVPFKHTGINFTSKNLHSFKNFCKQELLLDLRMFEKGRRQALVTLIVSSVILIVSIYLPTPLFIKLISTSHTTTDEVFEFIDFGLFSITLPISWYANLIIRLSILFIYVIMILVLFSGWSLLYNSLFETFSYGFDNKIGGKIHQFISSQENSNTSNLFFEQDINKTLQNLQHSQILDGVFKPNNIKQDSYIHGYANDISINITQIEAQSGFDHYWTRMLDIDLSATAPENFVSLNGLMLIGNVVLLCIPTLVMLIIRLIKGVPYVLTQVFQGKNIDYKRFKIEIINNQSYHKNIFKGLFFGAKFNKYTKVTTIIQPKGLKTDINSISHGNKELIKLEDPEFSQYFTVYSEDQVEARYILSTNLMEKLVNFKKKVGKNVYVSFLENMIYIAVEYPNGLFEPNLYKSMLSFGPLREYFEAIQLMLGIVEDLNLDRKIWSTNE
ncbi:hypothetical protein RIVM261_086990 [Rivularia sp. IAM M-261]|nr:hypothetical protein RIVM261_086990 [Rivularia sp. IAM M-261]